MLEGKDLADLMQASWRDGMRALRDEREAIAKERGTARLDALIQSVAHVAAAKLPAEVAGAVVPEARRICEAVESRLARDSWQARTHWVSLAQLHERSGELVESARAWMHVAAIAPHRALDAERQARALFVRAEAFDEWLDLHGSSMPRTRHRRTAAVDAIERSVLNTAVPLLERFFQGTRDADTLLVAGVDWETLDALEKAGCAPGAEAFLKACPPDYSDGPTFDGALVLPPSPRSGFVVEGSNCKHSKMATALLMRASSVVRRFDRLIATWGHAASDAASVAQTEDNQPVRDIDGLTPAEAAFVQAVGERLRDYLSESTREVWQFQDAPWATIESLAQVLGEGFLDEQANDAPAHKVLLQKTAPARKNTHFGGYVVWPPRPDFRVSLTSVTTPSKRVAPAWKKTADEVVKTGQRLYLWWD